MARSRRQLGPSGVYPYKIFLSCIMIGIMIFTVYIGQTAVVSFQAQQMKILQDQTLQQLLTYKTKKQISIGKALTLNQEFQYMMADYMTFFDSQNLDRQLTKQEKKLVLVYFQNIKTYNILIDTLFNLIDEDKNSLISDTEWNNFATFMQKNDPDGDFLNQSKKVRKFMKGLSTNQDDSKTDLTRSKFETYFGQIRDLTITSLQQEVDQNQEYDDSDDTDDDSENNDDNQNVESEDEEIGVQIQNKQNASVINLEQDDEDENSETEQQITKQQKSDVVVIEDSQDQSQENLEDRVEKTLEKIGQIQAEMEDAEGIAENVIEQQVQVEQEQEESQKKSGQRNLNGFLQPLRRLKGYDTQFDIITGLAKNATSVKQSKKAIGNLNEISHDEAVNLQWIIDIRRWNIIFNGIFRIFDEDEDKFIHQTEINDMAIILQMNAQMQNWIKDQVKLLGLQLHLDKKGNYFFSINQYLVVTERLRELYERYISESNN